jgi:zinc protease
MLQNKSNSPEGAFEDTSDVTVKNYHYMSLPWTVQTLSQIDLDKAYSFYKDRFSNASGMTFVFVGAIDTTAFRPLIETYIGGLPSSGEKQSWKDPGYTYAKGVIEKTLHKGIEPKSMVGLTFTGPFSWSRKNEYIIESLVSALDIRLREVIREDKSGTYGVWVSQNISKFPSGSYSFSITFGCDPVRAEELTKSVFDVIETFKKSGPADSIVLKVKEADKSQREVNIKRNGFWKGALSEYLFTGDNPEEILDYPALVSELKSDDIKKAANEYLKNDNYVKVVLMPEK